MVYHSRPTCSPGGLPITSLQGSDVKDRRAWNTYIDNLTDAQLRELGLTREQLELTRFCKDQVQDVDGYESAFSCSASGLERVVLDYVPDYQALFKFLYGYAPGRLHSIGSPGAVQQETATISATISAGQQVKQADNQPCGCAPRRHKCRVP
jgi:hypothetical protein